MPDWRWTGRASPPRRIFAGFLLVSAAAHAAVFGWLPALTRDTTPAQPAALQVAILDPLPLPVGAPERVPQARPSPRTEPQRSLSTSDARPRASPPEQVLSLPESRPDERHPIAAGAEVADPAVAAVPQEPSRAAAVAVAPPSFHAAYLSNPAPRYPDAARRSGEQGMVMLRVQVARDGVASRVAVEKSSGSPHLDAAALEAVKAWRFKPARRGADAVESWMLVPIVFRLDGAS